MERELIYLLVILNVSLGFFLFYDGFGRFGPFDYEHYLKKQGKEKQKKEKTKSGYSYGKKND